MTAGVFFGANSIRAMSLIHPTVGEAYARISTSVGWESKKDTYFDFILAHELHGLPTGTHIISPKLSATERHSTAHRAHFVDELIKLVPGSMAEFGKRLTDLSRDENRGKTILKFADGTTAEADAVIGCDGIRSVCREFVLGKGNPISQPTFTGKHAYRGLIPMDKAIAAIGEEKAQNRFMFIGKGGHVLTFPVANGDVMNVVAFSTTKSGVWEGEWVKRMERKDLAADFGGFGEECQKIFSVCLINEAEIKVKFNVLTWDLAHGEHRSLGHLRSFPRIPNVFVPRPPPPAPGRQRTRMCSSSRGRCRPSIGRRVYSLSRPRRVSLVI